MRPIHSAESRGPRACKPSGRGSLGELFRPWRNVLLLPAIVASLWGVICVLLGVAARLFAAEQDQPSWAEVAAASAYNAMVLLVLTLAISVALHLVYRRRSIEPRDTETAEVVAAVPRTKPEGRTVRGHRPVVPTTPEGRLALAAALLSAVPFVGGPALFAAPVLLVLAWRRGDRGLLLILPLLVGVFLVFFVIAEFTIGHD